MGTDSQAAGHGSRAEGTPGGPYLIEGTVLEASEQSCLRKGPAEGSLAGSVSAWDIGTGLIDGVDVSGQVVLVIRARGAGPDGARTQLMLLDEQATPEQVLALVDAFQGRLGGPLAHLVPSSGEVWALSQVPIRYRLGPGRVDIAIPDRLRLVAPFDSDPTDAPSSARKGAADLVVELREHGLMWHDNGMSATFRQFHVQSALEEGTWLA